MRVEGRIAAAVAAGWRSIRHTAAAAVVAAAAAIAVDTAVVAVVAGIAVVAAVDIAVAVGIVARVLGRTLVEEVVAAQTVAAGKEGEGEEFADAAPVASVEVMATPQRTLPTFSSFVCSGCSCLDSRRKDRCPRARLQRLHRFRRTWPYGYCYRHCCFLPRFRFHFHCCYYWG